MFQSRRFPQRKPHTLGREPIASETHGDELREGVHDDAHILFGGHVPRGGSAVTDTFWHAFVVIKSDFVVLYPTGGVGELVRYDAESFTVEASYYEDLTVNYDEIQAIDYREGNVDGIRLFGLGSFRLLLGTFQNEEFGKYTRYTYYRPESCVILTVNDRALVLSGRDRQESQAIYDALVQRVGD